jgi:tRNA(Ile)-lysidine synthase
VELFFLRLFRGAGVEGLAGMAWQGASPEDPGIRLIRPLLEERREDILEFARTERIRFREDASNRGLEIVRNRIRHSLLPVLRRRYQPALDAVILRTMTTLRDAATLVGEAAEAWRRTRHHPPFAHLPIALQRQILCLELRKLKVSVEFDLLERLRLHEGERISIASGRFLSRDQEARVQESTEVPFCQEEARFSLEGRGGEFAFGEVQFEWRFVALRAGARHPAKRRIQSETFDAAKVGSEVLLRHWRPGDRFQPSGFLRSSKLQDLFVNLHIPKTTRRRLVVAATASGEIFWVEGLRIAEGFKLDKSSRRGLKWAWRRTAAYGKGRLRPARAHGSLAQPVY